MLQEEAPTLKPEASAEQQVNVIGELAEALMELEPAWLTSNEAVSCKLLTSSGRGPEQLTSTCPMRWSLEEAAPGSSDNSSSSSRVYAARQQTAG